jgi:hypothetical protein
VITILGKHWDLEPTKLLPGDRLITMHLNICGFGEDEDLYDALLEIQERADVAPTVLSNCQTIHDVVVAVYRSSGAAKSVRIERDTAAG